MQQSIAMELRSGFGKALARTLYVCFDTVERLFNFFQASIRIQGNESGLRIFLEVPERATRSVDARIEKIDEARANLIEGLKAIDELKRAAEDNKKELSRAIAKIKEIEREKTNVEQELREIEKIASADIEVFRKVANIPSQSEIRKGRLLGFISGVIASVIASMVVWLISKLLNM